MEKECKRETICLRKKNFQESEIKVSTRLRIKLQIGKNFTPQKKLLSYNHNNKTSAVKATIFYLFFFINTKTSRNQTGRNA
jgi:hypothetical protein